LARIVENSRDLITVSGPDGKTTYLNEAGRRMLGIDPGEDLGAIRPQDFFFEEDLPRLRELDAQEGAASRERGYWEGEIRLRNRKTQRPVPVHFSVVYIKDPNTGKPLGSASIGRDITQRKKVDELARSNRELEQFAYVASHDLQEPLRMVASFVQLLAMEYKGKLDATADQYIQEAVGGVKRMQALILDLLAYSRLDSGGRPSQKVDCAEALRQALSDLEIGLRESGATVRPGELPEVTGDFHQIVQLFQNLVANALKFRSEKPPEIQVEARREGGEWLFCVRDNGIGLDPRYAEQIFEIFKRLHTRREYPGTGIGLAICKKVVARHGGRIWVESRPGEGAAFYWTLPAAGEAGGGVMPGG
ncbi:MAG TPA: ATP-binding protein, partial [bacterium]|nr:ATP-binding protein [bacterium]